LIFVFCFGESEWCGCGNSLQYAQVGSTKCDLACSGNSAEICGGKQTMSVYYAQISKHFNY
jgi:hypothetical protein